MSAIVFREGLKPIGYNTMKPLIPQRSTAFQHSQFLKREQAPAQRQSMLNNTLDASVEWIYSQWIFRQGHYRPYLFFTDLGMVIAVSVAITLCAHTPGLSPIKFVIAQTALIALYQVFLRLKLRLQGFSSRSLLQDLLFFILPMYVFLHWLLRHPVGLALDVMALCLPLLFSCVRLGCFFGGCCHGLSSSWGVCYPDTIFHSHAGCRPSREGHNPQARVIPTQLIESAVHIVLFIALYCIDQSGVFSRTGLLLPLYLMLYSIVRFVLDFWRRASVRPRWVCFSEAQCIATLLIVISSTLLLTLGGHFRSFSL